MCLKVKFYFNLSLELLSLIIFFEQVLPNEDKSAALDAVKTLFTSSDGSSLADSLIKSGDFETLANIAEAGSSILNNEMKSANSSKNATSEQLEAELNETLNRINVSLFFFLIFIIFSFVNVVG